MRLPRSMKINGEKWTVRLKHLAHRGLDGICLPRTREIFIDICLTPEERAETFIHEVLHACLREPWSTATEERMVKRLAPRLLAALDGIGWVP